MENGKESRTSHKGNTIRREERQLLDQWPEVVIGIVGFFLALLINSWIDHRGDNQTYQSILNAVQQEAGLNSALVDQKIVEFAENQLVVGQLSTGVLTQALANSLFVTHASDEDLKLLEHYLADSTRVESFRHTLEDIAVSSLPDKKKQMLSGSVEQRWMESEKSLQNDLNKVKKIT